MIGRSCALSPGIHHGVWWDNYLGLDAVGSTTLDWLSVSPLYLRHMMRVGMPQTPSMALGQAVHSLVLEPDEFERRHVKEPEARPRSTKEYKSAADELRASGRSLIKDDDYQKMMAMAGAVHRHPLAGQLLEKLKERELTVIWKEGERFCRGRADACGDGVVADLKTTRSLKQFSPFHVTKFGYYRQQAWYRRGFAAHGQAIDHVFLIAVESSAPYDVGVFALDSSALEYGAHECTQLLNVLTECEASDKWPGMFPDLQVATITNQLATETLEEGDALP